MRTRLFFALAFVCLASPALAQTATPAANPPGPDILKCNDPSVTRPASQTAISLQDSYPPLSVVLGEEGSTDLSFFVNANGTVSDAKVVRSSGSIRLDVAAVSAITQQIYSPAKLHGAPTICFNTLRFVWKLSNDAGRTTQLGDFATLVIPDKSAWPPGAVSRGEEGATLLAVTVEADGHVRSVRVEHSSGIDDLDVAAFNYVNTLSLTPGQIGGKAVNTLLYLVVTWSLQPVNSLPTSAP